MSKEKIKAQTLTKSLEGLINGLRQSAYPLTLKLDVRHSPILYHQLLLETSTQTGGFGWIRIHDDEISLASVGNADIFIPFKGFEFPILSLTMTRGSEFYPYDMKDPDTWVSGSRLDGRNPDTFPEVIKAWLDHLTNPNAPRPVNNLTRILGTPQY